MTAYLAHSPVLFILFNRPDTTLKVFQKIRETRPARLYIAADGPRENRLEDKKLCEESRSVIELIDWECEVKTLFRNNNLGCKYAVSSAIDWFFQHEEEGIILEDDCLPSNDFFRFCDTMLNIHRTDTRIRHITGCNLQFGQKYGNASYYFSNSTHVWGWASWKRAWNDYDVELSNYSEPEVDEQFEKIFNDYILAQSWKRIFSELKAGRIDTWDYQWGITNFFNNGLCIIPNYNLISNIGFRADGTHTFNSQDLSANIPLEPLPAILNHPNYFLPEKKADFNTWEREFNLKKIRRRLRRKKIRQWFNPFYRPPRSVLP